MGELIDHLGGKTPGQLIRSADWNALVAAIESVEQSLSKRLDGIELSSEKRIQSVTGRIDSLNSAGGESTGQTQKLVDVDDGQYTALNERIEALEEQLGSLRDRPAPSHEPNTHCRITVASMSASYAIGQLAEVTARITDVRGDPLQFADDSRPWIDFVTVWGRLKPVSGFECRGSSGDRAISVRVNDQGIAQVFLKSDHTEGFGEELENETAAFLNVSLQTDGASIADALLQSATPMESNTSDAFQALSAEYDREESAAFRKYVDAYYAVNMRVVSGGLIPRPIHKWRDHTTAVLAISETDRAIGCTQVTFRDWITPWIALEYLTNLKDCVDDARNRFAARVTTDCAESSEILMRDMTDSLSGKGILGKQREYAAIRKALDALPVSPPPPFLPTLVKTLQGMLSIQQAHDRVQAMAFVNDDQTVFRVLGGMLLRSDSTNTLAEDEVREAVEGMESIGSSIADLKNTVRFMEGRIDASLSEGGELQRIRSDLHSVAQQVSSLQTLDVGDVQDKLAEFQLIGSRLQALETKFKEDGEQKTEDVSG